MVLEPGWLWTSQDESIWSRFDPKSRPGERQFLFRRLPRKLSVNRRHGSLTGDKETRRHQHDTKLIPAARGRSEVNVLSINTTRAGVKQKLCLSDLLASARLSALSSLCVLTDACMNTRAMDEISLVWSHISLKAHSTIFQVLAGSHKQVSKRWAHPLVLERTLSPRRLTKRQQRSDNTTATLRVGDAIVTPIKRFYHCLKSHDTNNRQQVYWSSLMSYCLSRLACAPSCTALMAWSGLDVLPLAISESTWAICRR